MASYLWARGLDSSRWLGMMGICAGMHCPISTSPLWNLPCRPSNGLPLPRVIRDSPRSSSNCLLVHSVRCQSLPTPAAVHTSTTLGESIQSAVARRGLPPADLRSLSLCGASFVYRATTGPAGLRVRPARPRPRLRRLPSSGTISCWARLVRSGDHAPTHGR